MWQCRRNYANLLLLSVLFFALGANVSPRINCGVAGISVWQSSADGCDFRWECSSGQIIYRGQQITALAGSDFNFILPEKWDGLTDNGISVNEWPERAALFNIDVSRLPQGRAPPENTFGQ